jgi:hypothetical protein
MNARAQLKAVETLRPTAGQFALANTHALNLADHCYRAANQTEGSEARLSNERAAVLDLDETARLLGYDIVPARPRHG